MLINKSKKLYSKVDYDGCYFIAKTVVRIWKYEDDICLGCSDWTRKSKQYKTEKGAYKKLVTMSQDSKRLADSMFPEAVWSK